MSVITIIGSAADESCFFSLYVAKKIEAIAEGTLINFEALSEVDYLSRLDGYKSSVGGKFYSHNLLHVIVRDGAYLGGLQDLIRIAADEFKIDDAATGSSNMFERQAKEEIDKILNNSERRYVFLDFMDNSSKRTKSTPEYGKIIIELFNDLCPIAAENFRILCSGEKLNDSIEVKYFYQDCVINRLVPNGWLQCGDIKDNSGAHSVPATAPIGQYIPDESFVADFGFPLGGIVGYANNGAHTNGSQFFITLGPCSWMNTRYVGVGRVIFGFDVLRRLNVAKTVNQKPTPDIIISNCGIEK